MIAGAPVEEHLRVAFKSSDRHSSPTMQPGHVLPPINHSSRHGVPPPAGAVQQQGTLGASRACDSPGVHGTTAPCKPGTGHTRPPLKTTEVLLPGLNVVVPRHLTLRQSVPYDSVRQAELLDAKVRGSGGVLSLSMLMMWADRQVSRGYPSEKQLGRPICRSPKQKCSRFILCHS